MSFQAMSLVASIKKRPEICVIKKCLLLCMANYANDKFELWPSYQTLADDACINRTTAVRHIKAMVNMGVISRQKRPINNTYSQSNIYRLEVVQWLKNLGLEIKVSDKGYVVGPTLPSGTETLPSGTETLPSGTETLGVVAQRHQPSGTAPPNPVIEPINKPVIETNTPNLHVVTDYSDAIFVYWCMTLRNGATDLRFHKEQRSAVLERLKDGHSVEDIKLAILGCSMSEFHMGRIPGKPAVFDDLAMICKSGSQLDKFIAIARRGAAKADPYAELRGNL